MNQKQLIMASMQMAQAIRRGKNVPAPIKPVVIAKPDPEPMPEPMPVAQGATNVNRASLSELTAIAGLGTTIANGIIAGRPWAGLDELESNVRGVSWARIEAWGLYCD